jgi:hypothetical protein
MDNIAKSFLLSRVISYALKIQRLRKRRNLQAKDIHDAIHALGLPPLYSSLEIVNDDTVNTAEVVTYQLSGTTSQTWSLEMIVPFEADWTPSVDNFRKRRRADLISPFSFVQSSKQTKYYIEAVINGMNEQVPRERIIPPNDSDVLLASWFIGLHFTDFLNSESPVPWFFIRNCLWYLRKAQIQFSSISRNRHLESSDSIARDAPFPVNLSVAWLNGLRCIVENRVHIECDSSEQLALIRNVAHRILKQLE